MPPATYVARAVNRAFPVLHGQAFLALKRPDFGSEWFPATSRLRLGCALRPLPVQQKRFNSYNSETWYTSCARLGVDPNGSVKDFKKAYYKLAKVEHPDQDKTPGAKERFHKLQEAFEYLCKESNREEHDREVLARKKAAAAAAANRAATQPSTLDRLRAKWKAEQDAQDAQRAAEARDARTREAGKAAQGQDQRARPANPTGPKAGSRGPKGSEAEKPKQTPRKEKQRQEEPKETEEDRLRRQKAAEELAARRKAAADEEKRRNDEAKKAREISRLQERIVLIQGLHPLTKLVDVFEPLVELAPGPVFDARLRSDRVVSVEFCTDAAARKVVGLAQQGELYIKGTKVTAVRLVRSTNKIPVVGSVSRVLLLGGVGTSIVRIDGEDIDDFLERHGLQVERAFCFLGMTKVRIRLASWADAEKAKQLLERHLPKAEISYGPDPCGTRKTIMHRLLTSFGFTDKERERQNVIEFFWFMFITGVIIEALVLVYKYVPTEWKQRLGLTEDESEPPVSQDGD